MSRLILINFLFKGQRTRCRFSVSGCPFQLPSMELHEDRECKYRPTRCPSLTCPVKSPFIKLLRHLEVPSLHTCWSLWKLTMKAGNYTRGQIATFASGMIHIGSYNLQVMTIVMCSRVRSSFEFQFGIQNRLQL